MACIWWFSDYGDWGHHPRICPRPCVYSLITMKHIANLHSGNVYLCPYGSWLWDCFLHHLCLVLDWRTRPSKGSRHFDISVQLFIFHWFDHGCSHRTQNDRASQQLELACSVPTADVPLTFASCIYLVSLIPLLLVQTNVVQ